MNSPMADMPEHFPVHVDKQDNGPVEKDSPEYYRTGCACGNSNVGVTCPDCGYVTHCWCFRCHGCEDVTYDDD